MTKGRPGSRFDRLSLIPVQELRKYLTEKVARSSEDKKMLEKASQKDLVGFAKTKNLSKEQIEEIFEECRYARRLSFYLYLISNAQVIDKPLEDLLTYVPKERKASAYATAYEDLPSVKNLKFMDVLKLDDETQEVGFKYHSIYRFLSADSVEQPDHIYETSYGYFWVNLEKGFAVIITSDKKITRQVEIAFQNTFKISLKKPVLTKQLINDHFPLENSRGLTYNLKDVSKKYSTSSKSLFEDPEIGQEIRVLEDSSATRPNTLYDEVIDEDEKRSSNISISANLAKICLYSKFKASIVRKWFLERIYILMASLEQLYSSDLDQYLQSMKFEQIENFKVTERKIIISLASALWKWKEGTSGDEIPFSAEAQETLKSINLSRLFLEPIFRFHCEDCASIQPAIYRDDIEIFYKSNKLKSSDSLKEWSLQDSITVHCPEGHSHSEEVISLLQLIPNSACIKSIEEILATRNINLHMSSLNFYLSNGQVIINRLSQDTVVSIYDIEHFKNINLFDEQHTNYKKLRSSVRELKEKCDQRPTAQMCLECPTETDRICLMKAFHFIEPGYKPAPHHGNEYGDIHFPSKLNGQQITLKFIMKSYAKYKSGENKGEIRIVTPTTREGEEILRQVVTQYLRDPYDPLLVIIAPPSLDGWLKNDIVNLVKYKKGRVCFIEELELVQILNGSMSQGLTGFELN